jgi:hypothetical protein
VKTKIIALLSALLINFMCFSQDILTYKNGTEVKAKVVEVTSSEVKFKRLDNPDGPLYTISKSDLFMIKYENGTKEVFTAQSTMESVPAPTVPEGKEDFGFTRIHYNGPRVGVTFFGPGSAKDRLSKNNYEPFIIQFGWQFETRLFSLDNGTTGLVEWVLLAGGVEKGLFLPSATMLIGMRGGKEGFEFGLGPNLSVSGIGMAFAVGGSFKSGKLSFPVNLAIVPSVNNRLNDSGERHSTGARVSLLVGFNTRVR